MTPERPLVRSVFIVQFGLPVFYGTTHEIGCAAVHGTVLGVHPHDGSVLVNLERIFGIIYRWHPDLIPEQSNHHKIKYHEDSYIELHDS